MFLASFAILNAFRVQHQMVRVRLAWFRIKEVEIVLFKVAAVSQIDIP